MVQPKCPIWNCNLKSPKPSGSLWPSFIYSLWFRSKAGTIWLHAAWPQWLYLSVTWNHATYLKMLILSCIYKTDMIHATTDTKNTPYPALYLSSSVRFCGWTTCNGRRCLLSSYTAGRDRERCIFMSSTVCSQCGNISLCCCSNRFF